MEKTIFPIHFEDRGGIEFERLVFAFINKQKVWDKIEWLGQTGGENGRDIWGICNGNSYCYQCANYRHLPFVKIRDDIDKLVSNATIPDHYIVVCGGRVTVATRDKIRSYAKKIGIYDVDIWSAIEFEEKLRKETPELIERFVIGEDKYSPSDIPDLKPFTIQYIERQLNTSYFSLKYNPANYIPRALEIEIEEWLSKSKDKRFSFCYLILSPAGCGKTNLLCKLAATSAQKRSTFLLAGPHLRLTESKNLWDNLYEIISDLPGINNEQKTPRELFKQLVLQQKDGIAIFIDAINEYHDPVRMKHELSIFLEDARQIGIHVVLSCRDYYWGLFEATWWSVILRTEKGKNTLNRQLLSNYSSDEARDAFAVYFTEYNVSAQPEGNAVEQFRHPLLLRFFCETYRGKSLGILRDIRLKDLFDSYWILKLESIAERMINQGIVARVTELSHYMGTCILAIAQFMLQKNSRTITARKARALTHSSHGTSSLTAPYGRILDEHLILEEFTDRDPQAETMVAFVFEEFMEYSMAKAAISDWKNLDGDQICEKVRQLTKKYSSFSQIFGVTLYISLMLKEQRGMGLWPALIGLGEQWERVVIEAFKKLPPDQIDDGVFQALIDLLGVPNLNIQIEALELLKYGRLKRLPTPELIKAVGDLVTSDKLPVRRRAINALASFPPSFSISFLEKAVTTPMHRLTDQYVVVNNALTALAKLPTDESLVIIARTCAGYWHGHHRVTDVVNQLGLIAGKLIYLLDHDDLLVRAGSVMLLGNTNYEKALGLLKQKLLNNNFSKRKLKRSNFPEWVTLSFYDFLSSKTEGAFEKELIEKAIKSIKVNISKYNDEEIVRTKIQNAIKEKKLQGVPFDIDSFKDIFYNPRLIIHIIKTGLEHRSGKKWQVTGNYSRINIKAPVSRLNNGKMTIEDISELKKILNIQKLPGLNNEDLGAEISNGYKYNGYYEEYVYRAWGVKPKVLGWYDYYD